jgi:hypothetical protein
MHTVICIICTDIYLFMHTVGWANEVLLPSREVWEGRGHGIYMYSLLLCIQLSVINVQLLITHTVGWANEVLLPSREVWEGRGHGIYMYSLLLCIQLSVINVQLLFTHTLGWANEYSLLLCIYT